MRDERGLAASAAPRFLRERESQREGLERDGRFGAAQRSRNAGLGHRAGEGFQLAEVVLAPRAGRAGARAGRSRGGALGNSGHEKDLWTPEEGASYRPTRSLRVPLHTLQYGRARSRRFPAATLGGAPKDLELSPRQRRGLPGSSHATTPVSRARLRTLSGCSRAAGAHAPFGPARCAAAWLRNGSASRRR